LTTYHYQLVAYNAGGTVYGPDATFVTLAYPPLVITDGATNVGTNTAVLNGQVNPNGLATSAWFEWGTTTAYGFSNKATAQALSPLNSYIIVSPLSIGSLAPNTTYYYRAVAQSSAGTTTGVARTFTTLSGGVSPPGLSFSPDPGYNSTSGFAGTNPYPFKVVYTSPSNLAPTLIALYLDGDRTGLPMTLDVTPMGSTTSLPGGPVMNLLSVAEGIVGAGYTQIFTATGGTLPYTWSVTGSLPAGLTLNTASGIISGTPGASGTYPLTIAVIDSSGTPLTATVNVNLVICSYTTGCQYRVTPPLLNAGVGFYFFAASDGQSTISLSSSGTLAGPTVPGTPSLTPVGNNVVVTPVPGYAVKFATLNVVGNTNISTLATVPAIPASYTLPLTNIYQRNISTTAGYIGTETICINYSSAYFINQNAIVMLHYDTVQARWVNVTSSLDVVHNIACGAVSALDGPYVLVMTGSTAVGISSFNTTAGDANVMVEWSTQTETNQLGFNVLRGLSLNGPFSKINAQIIPSRGNSIYGARYRYMDYGVMNGLTYYYQLESVDTGNKSVVQFVSIANPQAQNSSTAVPEGPMNVDPNSPSTSGTKGNGTTIIQLITPDSEAIHLSGKDAESEKTEAQNLVGIQVKVLSDRVVLSWTPLDSADTYMVWRSDEKNGFYQMINDKLVIP
ncbi:MAG: putative Ig domain-containing protein, partial [Nitrospirae bacterium]|nr:putative Ig domain-containing protein [Nitrospirota bacterium]